MQQYRVREHNFFFLQLPVTAKFCYGSVAIMRCNSEDRAGDIMINELRRQTVCFRSSVGDLSANKGSSAER